jgi:hypothetical protein
MSEIRPCSEIIPSESTRQRIADLIAREKSSGLNAEETSELDHFLQLEHLMRLAKARLLSKASDDGPFHVLGGRVREAGVGVFNRMEYALIRPGGHLLPRVRGRRPFAKPHLPQFTSLRRATGRGV